MSYSDTKNAARAVSLGFIPSPIAPGWSVCRRCYIAMPTYKLSDMARHCRSSFCSWRVADGSAAEAALKLGMEMGK